MNSPINLNRAVSRGSQGFGLAIDANELSRLCTKAEAYAQCGDTGFYVVTLELIAERLEAIARLAPLVRASINTPTAEVASAPYQTQEAA